MDANQTPKKKLFICKFCNKKFPCGKSLGGHIRIHLNGNGNGNMNSNSPDVEDEADFELKSFAGYGLRENPKKTRRFSADSKQNNLMQEKICRECGKGFQSLKALCGHMASHSRASFEDQSETTEKLKDHVFDSQSDTETSSAPSKRRRSARMRYKAVDFYNSLPNNGSVSDDNELEQEEVAMCLMMLSRDSGFKGCFAASIAEFSDDDSVFVGTKSNPKLRISVKNGISSVYNGNGNSETKKSGFGNCRYGSRKFEPETPVHIEFKKQKMGFGSKYEEELDPEIGKRLSRLRRIKTELGKDIVEYDETESVSRKRGKNYDSYNTKVFKASKSPAVYESDENSIETEPKKIQSSNGKSPNVEQKPGSKKGKVHECPFCYKVFRSGQALGGHKRSHFVGGSEDRTVVIDHQVPEVSMSSLIDLNLPAPMEDDTNGYYLASW